MEAMHNDPLFQHEQQADDEERELYYGETRGGRMLAIAITWRGQQLRIVTAYNLDASQIRDYLQQRLEQL
jgi:uncharacterized DUF497 family protein